MKNVLLGKSLLNCVPYVLTCQRGLRAKVLCMLKCQRILRAYVLASTQATLAREHVRTQSTLAREHAGHVFSTQGTQFSRLARKQQIINKFESCQFNDRIIDGFKCVCIAINYLITQRLSDTLINANLNFSTLIYLALINIACKFSKR